VNYREALAWLYSLQRFGIKLGLENSRRLFQALGCSGVCVKRRAPGTSAPTPRIVHVAGTNGKGSVCAMIDAILRAQGIRSGLFTSPHLVTFRERIQINGELISEEAVTNGLTLIRDLIAEWEPHPTFFEVTTGLALKHFSENNIDIAVLETGLGGRLDATNALVSDVAVITSIALDHQKWLGENLTEIAAEKAGIIKGNTPVVSAAQAAEAEKVIRARAAQCGASLQFILEPYEESPIALRGSYQQQNAALAIAALRAVRSTIRTESSRGEIDPPLLHCSATGLSVPAIARGLAAVKWPARFQAWDERTIIDGAHNPAAAHVLAQTWRETLGPERATLILAVLSDKDLPGVCQALAPISDFVLLPHIRSQRAASPDELAKIFKSVASVGSAGASPAGNHSGCPTISITPSISDALDSARARPNRILLTGSLHFAGEALAFLQGKPAAFEECPQ
jgi:dihydrofolate synthase/folylpolyglutamate synthase